jgi:hypothetical protein
MKSSSILSSFVKIAIGVGITVLGVYFGTKLISSGVVEAIDNYNPQDAATPVFANEWQAISRILFEIRRLTPQEYLQLQNYPLDIAMQGKSILLQLKYPNDLTDVDADNFIKYILKNRITELYPIIDYLDYGW